MSETLFKTEKPDSLRLRDPLSEVTRKERRALLGGSLFAVAVAQSGLLPTEIAALGVKLAAADQRTLLLLIAIVCSYYLFAFVTYAASDFTAWQVAIREAISERMIHSHTSDLDQYELHIHSEVEDRIAERFPWLTLTETFIMPVSRVRALFEFVLPIGVGLYAIIVLVVKSAA